MNTKLLFAPLAALFAVASSAETVSLRSPDGRNEIRLETEPELAVSVWRDGKARLAPSAVGMKVEGHKTFAGGGLEIVARKPSRRSGTLDTPLYKKASVDLAANVTRVDFADGWSLELAARDDAVAYRVTTAFPEAKVKVLDDRSALAFPSKDLVAYAGLANGHYCSWESIYSKTTTGKLAADAKPLVYLPLVVTYPDGGAMCVTESDLLDYAGWNLRGAGGALKADLARLPDPKGIKDNGRGRHVGARFDYIAETAGVRSYPWRAFLLADRPEKLIENDAVVALASPNRLAGDTSWIKPGKVAWEWWNSWNVFGPDVDFEAGCNTETYKYYIDFAARTGVEYVIMDEGWSVKLRIMEISPVIDLQGIIDHARDRGVGIILWCSWPQLVGRQREVFGKYAAMGVKGFKIDFMDRDDQFVVAFVEETARIAADYRLLIDYHGMYKPTGLSRTYPNVINYEGVHGLETAKFNKSYDMPGNDLKVFFTRMVAGPMDYTPGAMRCRSRVLGDVSWPKKFDREKTVFEPNWNQPDVQGTRVHQMALMSLYEAPLQMLCDSPSQYLANMECFEFMAAVPTVWDETVAVAGDIDRHAAAARRKGDVWYLSAIASWDGAELELDTSFLKSGKWDAEIFEDGPNALHAPVDYRTRDAVVEAGRKIKVRLAPGGGWTARLSPRPWWKLF